ncbi:hypothetical protein OJF2_72600 [Aquisphaera giovannonii]|uniref:Uncharacterized protein n=1 Tax=Aquisphaera giovannonii TaxID=406548 RepID=A0A5B9WEL0_9BACT|nr:hypothetical protein [Aquisphaera giovannonii]QEH38654.1 hypothetical protein OJF2_72600 [Aquisphaera giovannonii]
MPNDTYVAPVIQPSGTTFAQFQSGGYSVLIDNLIAANGPVANPSVAATVSVGGTGGSLAAGTYQVAYTFRDAFGESLAGGQSATFTVAAGQVATVTLPALPAGADEIWLYATAANNPTGPLSLYATGITSTSFAMSSATGSDPSAIPTPANTTGALSVADKIRSYRGSSGDQAFKNYSAFLSTLLRGAAIGRKDGRLAAQQWAAVFAVWAQAAREAASLVLLNPGTVSYKYSTVGHAVPSRTWP